jgi:type VI secretion system secreted protein Hcp
MAFNSFIKLEGAISYAGESTHQGKEGWSDIFSFSWGASNPVTVGGKDGLAAGKASVSSFNIMKRSEKSSGALFLACCSGEHIDKVTVELHKAAGTSGKTIPFITYTFEQCMIESVQWSGSSGGDDTPTESVSIAFTKVKISYQAQDEKGAKKGGAMDTGWNVAKNEKA